MPPASPDRSWPYTTSGIPDDWFAQLPGIPLTKREVRLLILAQLRLEASSCLWDVGAGTGTIPVEAGLLCPKGKVIAIERDEEVCALIQPAQLPTVRRQQCRCRYGHRTRLLGGDRPLSRSRRD